MISETKFPTDSCKDPISRNYEQISEEENARKRKFSFLFTAGGAFTALTAGVGTVFSSTFWEELSPVKRVVSTLSPVGTGLGLGFLLSRTAPRKLMSQIRLEGLRLGIFAYFWLTQLYLNTENETERKWIINSLLALYGFQISTIIDSYVIHRFEKMQNNTETNPLLDKKSFTILDKKTDRSQFLASLFYGITGIGMFTGSFYVPKGEDQQALCAFGTYCIAQGTGAFIWEKVENWGKEKEKKFKKNFSVNAAEISLPKSVYWWRVAEKIVETVPIFFIGACFYHPTIWTVTAAGGMHGIQESHRCFRFKEYPESYYLENEKSGKLSAVYNAARRIMLHFVSSAAFGYLVFDQGDENYNLAIGAFLGSGCLSYGITSMAARKFKPRESSRLMQTLFYHCLSDSILGVNPLYFYLYTAMGGFKIGSQYLTDMELRKIVIAFLSWAGYGWTMGRGAAIYETPYGRQREQIPSWLMGLNIITLIQRLRGDID